MAKGKNQIEAARRDNVSIEKMTRKAAIAFMNDPDAEDVPQWFRELPPGERSKIILKFLPNAKPVDQDFRAQMLDLAAVVDDLDRKQDLTRQLYSMRKEVEHERNLRSRSEALLHVLKRRQSGAIEEKVIELVEQAETDWRKYFSGLSEQGVSRVELRETIKEVMEEGSYAKCQRTAARRTN